MSLDTRNRQEGKQVNWNGIIYHMTRLTRLSRPNHRGARLTSRWNILHELTYSLNNVRKSLSKTPLISGIYFSVSSQNINQAFWRENAANFLIKGVKVCGSPWANHIHRIAYRIEYVWHMIRNGIHVLYKRSCSQTRNRTNKNESTFGRQICASLPRNKLSFHSCHSGTVRKQRECNDIKLVDFAGQSDNRIGVSSSSVDKREPIFGSLWNNERYGQRGAEGDTLSTNWLWRKCHKKFVSFSAA